MAQSHPVLGTEHFEPPVFSPESNTDDLHDAGFDDLHGAFSQAELLARLPAAGFVLCTLYARVGSMILIYHLTSTVQYIVCTCMYILYLGML